MRVIIVIANIAGEFYLIYTLSTDSKEPLNKMIQGGYDPWQVYL